MLAAYTGARPTPVPVVAARPWQQEPPRKVRHPQELHQQVSEPAQSDSAGWGSDGSGPGPAVSGAAGAARANLELPQPERFRTEVEGERPAQPGEHSPSPVDLYWLPRPDFPGD